VVVDLRLPEGFAKIVDIYARRTSASRNQALAGLVLAGMNAYCDAESSFQKALKASDTEEETSNRNNYA